MASRLGWPFVELFPSRLAGTTGGLAGGLSAAFAALGRMAHVLVFIDDVEEIASDRARGAEVGVVNELLKSIVGFRERDERLLVCATNSIDCLDPALLRHGRFDYVLPISLPDDQARRAMWHRAMMDAGADLDVERLVVASRGLTPADIEHACPQAAAASFDGTLVSGTRSPPGRRTIWTQWEPPARPWTTRGHRGLPAGRRALRAGLTQRSTVDEQAAEDDQAPLTGHPGEPVDRWTIALLHELGLETPATCAASAAFRGATWGRAVADDPWRGASSKEFPPREPDGSGEGNRTQLSRYTRFAPGGFLRSGQARERKSFSSSATSRSLAPSGSSRHRRTPLATMVKPALSRARDTAASCVTMSLHSRWSSNMRMTPPI